MHCSNCNKTIPDGSKTCPYCYSEQNKSLPNDVPPKEIIPQSNKKSTFESSTPYFIIFPALLVFALDIVLFVFSFGIERYTGFTDLAILLVNLRKPLIILMAFSGINIIFWFIMSVISKYLQIPPVHPATYIINILITVVSSFLPDFLPFYVLPTWMIIMTLFTLVKLQTVAHAVGLNMIPGTVLCGSALAIAAIIVWATTCYNWCIVLFGVVIAVHIFIIVKADSLWGQVELYAQKHNIVVKKKSADDKKAVSRNICPKCGKEIPVESEFCLKCGARVIKAEEHKKLICQECGKEIPGESEFCPKCGARVIKSEEPKTLICKACGKEIPGESEFCPKCGMSLSVLSKGETEETNTEQLQREESPSRIIERQKTRAFFIHSVWGVIATFSVILALAALINYTQLIG